MSHRLLDSPPTRVQGLLAAGEETPEGLGIQRVLEKESGEVVLA